ncbi:hypothetical protein [Undibacterium baiyunense]|uniref:HEPN AbiU2-like domain-containing protein n=1 Tax=Undibacterium baiyunense TaxID=2828731 RepID=A0A941I0Y2_9BURK|nr:hypothetical protein [Undibacterium baiyunense]MBR7745778.1 hypothetical protein [Undibacterium baiyunense]
MSIELQKLKAHSEHLLDGFLGLRERYAMLEPMLFNMSVIEKKGKGVMGRGFIAIKNNLFLFCCQDIAKLSLDKYDTSPSIKRIVEKLQEDRLLATLEEEFSVWYVEPPSEEKDPMVLDLLKRMDEKAQLERRRAFNELVLRLNENWRKLENKPALDSFKKIRNKASAHLDVNLVNGIFQPLDIGSLGVKWKDIGETIAEMQEIIEQIGLIVRNASFSWDSLDRNLEKASKGFWESEDVV